MCCKRGSACAINSQGKSPCELLGSIEVQHDNCRENSVWISSLLAIDFIAFVGVVVAENVTWNGTSWSIHYELVPFVVGMFLMICCSIYSCFRGEYKYMHIFDIIWLVDVGIGVYLWVWRRNSGVSNPGGDTMEQTGIIMTAVAVFFSGLGTIKRAYEEHKSPGLTRAAIKGEMTRSGTTGGINTTKSGWNTFDFTMDRIYNRNPIWTVLLCLTVGLQFSIIAADDYGPGLNWNYYAKYTPLYFFYALMIVLSFFHSKNKPQANLHYGEAVFWAVLATGTVLGLYGYNTNSSAYLTSGAIIIGVFLFLLAITWPFHANAIKHKMVSMDDEETDGLRPKPGMEDA